jgi:hypothetical protein
MTRDGRPRSGLSIFDRKQKSFLLYILPNGTLVQPTPYSVGTVGFFPERKTAGGWSEH